VPATAVLSLPVYGANMKNEEEVVVMGTPWREWTAWLRKAPTKVLGPVEAGDSLVERLGRKPDIGDKVSFQTESHGDTKLTGTITHQHENGMYAVSYTLDGEPAKAAVSGTNIHEILNPGSADAAPKGAPDFGTTKFGSNHIGAFVHYLHPDKGELAGKIDDVSEDGNLVYIETTQGKITAVKPDKVKLLSKLPKASAEYKVGDKFKNGTNGGTLEIKHIAEDGKVYFQKESGHTLSMSKEDFDQWHALHVNNNWALFEQLANPKKAEGTFVLDLNEHSQGPHWLSSVRRKSKRKLAAEWAEELHPRDDAGRFANGPGGGGAAVAAPIGPSISTASSTPHVRSLVERAGARFDGIQNGQLPGKHDEKWVWWTHPQTGSSSFWRVKPGESMSVEAMKADLDRHLTEFNSHRAQEVATGTYGDAARAENRQEAAAMAEHKIGAEVMYKLTTPGDKPPFGPKNEKWTVVGYGGHEGGKVFYRVRTPKGVEAQFSQDHLTAYAAPKRTPKPKAPKVVDEFEAQVETVARQGKELKAADHAYNTYGGTTEQVTRLMNERIEKHAPTRSPGGSSLAGLNVIHAREVAAEYETLVKEYPDVAADSQGMHTMMLNFGEGNKMNERAWAAANMYTGQIMLNSRFFEGYTDQINYDVKMQAQIGYHPANMTSVDGIVAHEFGHVVEGYVRRQMVEYEGVPDFQEPRNREWELPGLDYSKLAMASEYGATNKREAFAEAFADYTMYRRAKQRHPDGAMHQVAKSPAAAEIERWLMAHRLSPARHF
jgi:hypothetical protein